MLDVDDGQLCSFTGLASDAQRLMFAGRQLEDSTVLSEAGVSDEDTLYILARLMGGAKKRKKKTYTKPKKQKHKHKKIKLRVLKFFKVISNLIHAACINDVTSDLRFGFQADLV